MPHKTNRNLPFLPIFVGLAVSATIALGMEALPKKPPVPKDNPITPAKIELGKKLYFDKRLSKDGSVSCNSCHDVAGSGESNTPASAGVGGKLGGRSSPTVWNSAFMSVLFWDGRAASLEEQAKGPMINPVEMAMDNHKLVEDRLKQIPGYVAEFKKAFGGSDPVTIDNAVKAIATYERTLLTPDSPVDRFIRGDKKALSASAKHGMELVQSIGCVACHSGPNFGGNGTPGQGVYFKFPLFPGTEYEKKYHFSDDFGRYNVTKNEGDKNLWRVATWRNVALTAPYFHNGSVATLEEAVKVMGKTQLNRDISDADAKDIVAFLEGLTGKFPKTVLPELPPTAGTTMFPLVEKQAAAETTPKAN
jgi:cytochrome c peroxidase